MAAFQFDSLDQMPPGMRSLVEKQLSAPCKKTAAEKLMEASQAQHSKMDCKRKYHNLPTERLLPNGNVLKFRSQKEARFFDELRTRELIGQVRNIRVEVQFLLKPAYTDVKTGERYRAINYIADFVYEEKDEKGVFKQHIIDTKGGSKRGTRTKDYSIKRKLMADMDLYIEER